MAEPAELKAKAKRLRDLARRAERAAGGDYDDHRADMAARSRAMSVEGRDVGPLPDVADPARRNRGLDSLEFFARTYFPARFYLPFSGAHEAAISRLESCTNDGGQFACAMPRGSGKTALAEVACLRALLYGLRRFVVLVGATERHAARALKRLKSELESNDLLLADFPEACHPVRALERNPLRAKMQTVGGEPTRMEWTAEALSLPVVAGAASSGAAVQVAGLTAALRGLQVLGPDGRPVRPDLVLLDDVQTRESAKSPTQTAEREAVVTDDVLMLAGPTTRIAAVLLCTVIYPGDLSDRFLDPERHPEWRSVRTRTVVSMPADPAAWDAYAEYRRLALSEGDDSRANAYYREHRAALEAGAAVSWPERVKDGDVSAIQSAMHVYLDNPRGFHAELQNDPRAAELASGAKELAADAIAARLSGVERYRVPRECTRLTAGFDCGASLLWYLVVGWREDGGGSVVDYGCWPRQARSQFAAADARPSLGGKYPGHSESQAVFAGLRDLTAEVLGREYYREGGGEGVRVERALVDAGWQAAAVYQFVRQSPSAGVLLPSKGVGRTVTARGVGEWKPRPGERSGHHWRLTAGERGRGRSVMFDPDPWKTVLWERLTAPPGPGVALTLFGKSAGAHALLAEHLAAEYSVPATLRGVTFDKWSVRPDRPDNHLLDCAVLAAVAASVLGLKLEAVGSSRVEPPAPGKPLDLKALQAERRAKAKAPGGREPLDLAALRDERRGVRR